MAASGLARRASFEAGVVGRQVGSARRLAGIVLSSVIALAGCGGEFDMGVGAFEVGTDDAVLWTHVVPKEVDQKGVWLTAKVATDPEMKHIVRVASVVASVNDDFTARTRVKYLQPGTQYYYQFWAPTRWGVDSSVVGSFRTAPEDTDTDPVRFVISGDSNLGYVGPRGLDFHVMSAAAAENPDFFVYFGDTIYADSGVLPGGADAVTLDEYREVHRLTRADPHLQTIIASTATYTGWDDHEVRNDYDGETVDPAQFEAGARAFFEYLPLRVDSRSAPYVTHRRVRYGKHVELFMIDGRQYRTAEKFCNEVSPDGPAELDTLFSPFVEDELIAIDLDPFLGPAAASLLLTPSDPACVAAELAAPGRSMLGTDQLAWLKASLLDSDATFKIIVNDVPIASLLVTPYDRWEGYIEERNDLLAFIGANLDPDRTLVIATDFHTNMAIEMEQFTEVIVGPIGQTTFETSVLSLIPPALAPFIGAVLNLFDNVVDVASGPPQAGPPFAPTGAVLASAHDAFSYARVDIAEDQFGDAKLTLTVRGNPDYAAGANDPNLVQDLFSIEMP